MAGPEISVLLPARDAEATLAEALASLAAQRDAPPWELVCVDDASTDGTPRILAAAAAVLPREVPLRIVRGEGRGLVAALNLGLAHCRAPLIARMDADDRARDDRLALQHAFLAARPALGAAGSLVRLFPEPLTPGLVRYQELLDSLVTEEECANGRFVEAPLVHPSMLLRRAALDAVGGFHDRGWAEDWDLQLRLVEAGYGLAKVPEVLLWWRDGPRRLTRTHAAYAPAAMQRLRAHHLARGPLRERPFEIWGAGPTGKRLARALEAHGLRPRRFIDVARDKRVARGAQVVHESALGPPGDALVVCAVGAAGARAEIRAALQARGYREGPHFLFAA